MIAMPRIEWKFGADFVLAIVSTIVLVAVSWSRMDSRIQMADERNSRLERMVEQTLDQVRALNERIVDMRLEMERRKR